MAATYTVRQVAEILGYSTNSIYTFLKEKRIKGVRVGKGRFRIPQSELDRLLLISKKQPIVSPATITPPTTSLGVVEASNYTPLTFKPFWGGIRMAVSNIFDWFIATGAIVSGIALFLFNQTFVSPAATAGIRDVVVSMVRIILIGSGLGVLFATVFGKHASIWRRVFFIILAVAGLGMTVLLTRFGDIDGALIYGSLSLTIIISVIASTGGLASFSLYLTALALAAGVAPILGSHDKHVVALTTLLNLPVPMLALLLGITGIMFSATLWWGYFKERKMFWLATWGAAFVFFALALVYGQYNYWSRAFFFVVTGVTSLFCYLWEELVASTSKREHTLLTGVFGVLGIVMVIGILVVRVMQTNEIEMVKREDVQKVSYARIRTEMAVSDVKNTLMGVVTLTDFIDNFAKKDIAELNIASRIIYDSNKNIRRLVYLDRGGEGFLLYPFGTFDQTNLSFRDYYTMPRDTGKLYVSNVFQALVDQSQREVVVVSAPVFTKEHAFMGVVAASLDLQAIGARLQQIGVPERGEYVTIVDSKGKLIIGPDAKLVGVDSDKNDPTRLGTTGQSGVVETTLADNTNAVVAYDTVDELHWGIGVWSPVSRAYQLTSSSTISLFLLIFSCILAVTILVQGAHFLWHKSSGGSP